MGHLEWSLRNYGNKGEKLLKWKFSPIIDPRMIKLMVIHDFTDGFNICYDSTEGTKYYNSDL